MSGNEHTTAKLKKVVEALRSKRSRRLLIDTKLSCEVVSDTEKNWAGWFRLMHNGPAHGTLLVDANGEVPWSTTDDEPYMEVETLVKRVRQLRGSEQD